MIVVKFVVPGPPFGKQRPKVYANRNGKGSHAVTPEKTVVYENLVKEIYWQKYGSFRFPDDAMLDMRVIAYFPIPKSTSKKRRQLMIDGQIRPTKKPDWDNVGKVVSDAMNNVAFNDDKQIVDSQIRKFYSENPRVVVTIQEATPVRRVGVTNE